MTGRPPTYAEGHTYAIQSEAKLREQLPGLKNLNDGSGGPDLEHSTGEVTLRIMLSASAKRLILGLGVCLLCTTHNALGTALAVEHPGVTVTRSLSGHVYFGDPQVPASGAHVELCSDDWKTILDSTTTDSNGAFSLTERPGKLFFIRISAHGVNQNLIRVRVSKRAKHDLMIYLIWM